MRKNTERDKRLADLKGHVHVLRMRGMFCASPALLAEALSSTMESLFENLSPFITATSNLLCQLEKPLNSPSRGISDEKAMLRLRQEILPALQSIADAFASPDVNPKVVKNRLRKMSIDEANRIIREATRSRKRPRSKSIWCI